VELQSRDATGSWQTTDDRTPLGGRVFDEEWELACADEHLRHSTVLLPFQPASFRDFMLYEQHVLDASRGLVRRFHPGQYRLVETVEALTRRTFPLLKPKPLFYTQPIYYMSNAMTFVPSGTPIAAPSYTHALDYELEIGFVLARGLFNAAPAQALDAIGAFVVLNDWSARDVQRAEMDSGFGPQKAKHFASSLSEVAVTAAEILPRIGALQGTVSINGSTVSTVSSAGMQHSLGEVLAHASRSEHLRPGELFATGTLPGGSGMETGHWLQPGDAIELSIDGIGHIEHTIIGS
jgi:2-keto-4-pentenoate hydratase/2-oxohepta-3-ene-1,7-dioic acid hydratase in catechol pathway